ncbi:MAG: hypothetical protein SP4CHLAM5_04400 [Chlamydiia bacterium]|nr:hypothetical protein [Chlamydiia bacterium]MCH9618313.1 hypothetical protein [Chlamydiia bacterium]MCH9624186.1 hypothetical protein [Chlamydiia bacterium]
MITLLSTITILTMGCHSKKKGELVHLQVVDRNGFTKTISDSTDIKKYENLDPKASSHHKKVVRVYDKDGAGAITLYHDSGTLWQYLETKSNRAHGMYEEYFPTGKIKIRAFISEGIADLTDKAKTSWVFDGESSVFDEHGNTMATIFYEKGREQGEALYYFADGSIKTKIPYLNGKIQGKKIGYDKKGTVVLLVNYFEGKKDGESFFKGSEKEGAFEEVYMNGRLVYGSYLDLDGKVFSKIDNSAGIKPIFQDGQLVRTEEYKNGRLEGLITLFGRDRTIESTYMIKEGKKDGEEIIYYQVSAGAEPIKKLLVTWKEGQIHGKVCSWYPNGALESEKDMCDHKKEGAYLSWYMDSSLMMVEEYSHDKLVNGKYLRKGDNVPISRVIDGMGTAHIYDQNGILLRKVSYYNGSPVE